MYWAISQILLFWHTVWSFLSGKTFLATNWDWILAIVFLVVTVRVILFPLFVKQIKSQRAMQAIAPQIKELQEKHKGDRETLQKEMMELYRKEKANPLMGCLPMFLQIPVFLGLFHVLRRVYPGNQAKTLYGWSVEQFDSASSAKLFGAPIWGTFSTGSTNVKIVAGVLVVIMIATTFLTSRQMILKTGWAEDPNQKLVQRLMLYGIPASLLISGGIFPIGVVIYWVVQNLFSMGQQFWVLRKYPPPKMSKIATAGAKGAAGRGTPASRGTAAKSSRTAAAQNPDDKLAAARARLFGRGKPAPEPEPTPAVDGKALAPKPGAKPTNPKKGGAAKQQAQKAGAPKATPKAAAPKAAAPKAAPKAKRPTG
jgi:YidC/Oxa1 family membrane protein insertase